MGSDATEKSHYRRGILRRLHHLSPTSKLILALGCLSFVVLLLIFLNLVTQQDDFDERSHTFSPEDVSHLPERCMSLAKHFHHCQGNTKKKPVVLACHRKWCNSYGHCEPCAGIGDRTIHMLSLVQEALQRCIPVQLDYPLPGIQLVSDAVYHDPMWFQEVLHQRSYDVTPRTINTKEWGEKEAFVHFTPENYTYRHYDMCLFHILFRPAPALQQIIEYHREQMGPNAIGIHFRSGDTASFGFDNKDVRITNIADALYKMLTCGEQLAETLYAPGERYTFFLATDNAKAKELAETLVDTRYSIYQTAVRPSLYVSSDTESDAWMEVYLLSMMQGLVVNVRPEHYEGKSGRLSLFSLLAKRIGFIEDNVIMECHLD